MINTTFLLDANLELTVDEKPWLDFMAKQGIKAIQTTDLPYLDEMVARHEPDIAFMPIADFHRLLARGDNYYRGFVIGTSKFTGTTNLPSVLVVRVDDPAESLQDLQGAKYAYINKSCSSSYFPPAILLGQQGKKFDDFLDMVPTAAWQGQIDAVIAKQVRATMVPEDTWRTNPANAQTTKIVDRYDNATPALVVVRQDLDDALGKVLQTLWYPGFPSGRRCTARSGRSTTPTCKVSSTTSTSSRGICELPAGKAHDPSMRFRKGMRRFWPIRKRRR